MFSLLVAWLFGIVSGWAILAAGAFYFAKIKLAKIEESFNPSDKTPKVELPPIDLPSQIDDNPSNSLSNSNSERNSPRNLEALDETSFVPLQFDISNFDKKKKEKDKAVLDPIALAIKNKRAGRTGISNLQEETLKSGWLKIRGSLNVWWNRWVVLKPGKLIYYQSEKKEDCFGIVVLNECNTEQKSTDKKGFCFVVFHPGKKTIYSDKGLKGETLKSAKFPGNSSECIIRSPEENEGKVWLDSIQKAIQMASVQEFPMQTISDTSNSSASSNSSFSANSSISIPASSLSVGGTIPSLNASYSSSNPPPLPPKPRDSLLNAEETPKNPETAEVSSSKLLRKSNSSSNSLHSSMDRKDIAEIGLTDSSDDENEENSEEKEKEKSLEEKEKILEKTVSDPNLPLRSESIEIPKKTVEVARNPARNTVNLPLSLPNLTSTISSLSPSTPPSASSTTPSAPVQVAATVIIPAAIVEIPGDYPISQSIPASRKEGYLELKTVKGWKSFFFVLRAGLISFFENEKAIDCVGVVDLEDCHVTNMGEGIFQVTGSGKRQNVFIPNENGGQSQDHPFVYGIVLKNEESFVSVEWIRLIEEEIPKVHRSSPLVLPRIPSFVGEKSHWFNIALTQIFQKHLQPSTALQFKFKAVLMKKFERIKRPDYLGEIHIEDIYLGDDMFHFTEVSAHRTGNGELVGEADVNYNGKFSLKLSTQISILGVTVPVNVSVKLMKLSGRAVLYNSPEVASRFAMAFVELPDTKFDIQLQVGQRTRLDINKYFSIASDFLLTMLKKLIFRNTVAPNRVTFSLPIPGKKFSLNTVQLTSRSRVKTVQVPQSLSVVPQVSTAIILDPSK